MSLYQSRGFFIIIINAQRPGQGRHGLGSGGVGGGMGYVGGGGGGGGGGNRHYRQDTRMYF